MRLRICIGLLLLVLTASLHAAAETLPPLQLFIDLTPAGTTLRPPPGVYGGPVVIDRAIVLDGQGQVTVDGQGSGTVIRVRADDSELRGLQIRGSGSSHDALDAGLAIEADGVLIEEIDVDDVLFGIVLSQGDGNVIRNNRISSRPGPATLRGDGIRLWFSRDNRIEGNHLRQVRDMVFTNSPDNQVVGNHVEDGRMAMELIFSPGVEIADNHFSGNEHGVVAIYSDSLHIHHNRIEHQSTLTGSALAVKGSSQTRIEHNEILDCAVGLTANSPTYPENILYLRENRFAYNDVAMYFYGEKGGHVVHGNRFEGNFQQVAVTGPTSALGNDWRGNYWQDYTGFDRDGDGTGDTPYTLYLFSERIWLDQTMAKFFRGTPMLELIDLVERLAPFSEPKMIMSDPEPRLR
jgi:nitrous oxidase accessory protein